MHYISSYVILVCYAEGDVGISRFFFITNCHGFFGALGIVDAAANCALFTCVIALSMFAIVKSNSVDWYLVSDFGASPT